MWYLCHHFLHHSHKGCQQVARQVFLDVAWWISSARLPLQGAPVQRWILWCPSSTYPKCHADACLLICGYLWHELKQYSHNSISTTFDFVDCSIAQCATRRSLKLNREVRSSSELPSGRGISAARCELSCRCGVSHLGLLRHPNIGFLRFRLSHDVPVSSCINVFCAFPLSSLF